MVWNCLIAGVIISEEPDPKYLLTGDVDGDGAVTRADAQEIQRFAIGLRAGL